MLGVVTFFHPITFTSQTGERMTLEALVDTGATFTALPRDTLVELGVKPVRDLRLRMADGSSNIQPVGRVLIELDGFEEVNLVVFGGPGAPPAIGALTLESLLLGVDPVGKRLVPVEGWQA